MVSIEDPDICQTALEYLDLSDNNNPKDVYTYSNTDYPSLCIHRSEGYWGFNAVASSASCGSGGGRCICEVTSCTFEIDLSRSDDPGVVTTTTVQGRVGDTFIVDGCSATLFAGPLCNSTYGVASGARLIKNQRGEAVQSSICCNSVTSDVVATRSSCTSTTSTAPPSQCVCTNTCGQWAEWAFDGTCDDNGPGGLFNGCALGSDCADCGPSTRTALAPGDVCPTGSPTVGPYLPGQPSRSPSPPTSPPSGSPDCVWAGRLSYFGCEGSKIIADDVSVEACKGLAQVDPECRQPDGSIMIAHQQRLQDGRRGPCRCVHRGETCAFNRLESGLDYIYRAACSDTAITAPPSASPTTAPTTTPTTPTASPTASPVGTCNGAPDPSVAPPWTARRLPVLVP